MDASPCVTTAASQEEECWKKRSSAPRSTGERAAHRLFSNFTNEDLFSLAPLAILRGRKPSNSVRLAAGPTWGPRELDGSGGGGRHPTRLALLKKHRPILLVNSVASLRTA